LMSWMPLHLHGKTEVKNYISNNGSYIIEFDGWD
jgi:hypothetical protein